MFLSQGYKKRDVVFCVVAKPPQQLEAFTLEASEKMGRKKTKETNI